MNKLIMVVLFLLTLTGLGCYINNASSVSENSQNLHTKLENNSEQANKQNAFPLNKNRELNNSNDSSTNEQPQYIGCWNGMRGGKLKITLNKIYDIGSKEESTYKEKFIAKKETKEGIQTGEEYLLEADSDFPESFLAKLIRLLYNSDGTVGIITYDSYEEYLEGKFVGQGLFEKTSCK